MTLLERPAAPVVDALERRRGDDALSSLLAIAGVAIVATIEDHRAAAARRARILELDGPASLAAFIEDLATW